jgi:hypothetical protein
MINYWYCARPNELFLDIDNVSRSIKHARARLQGAIECGKLDVVRVMQHTSRSKNHLHAIVTLVPDVAPLDRYLWEILLHGDLYRGLCNIRRELDGISAPDVLISPYGFFCSPSNEQAQKLKPPFTVFQRNADDSCYCKTKHNAATMETCPAAKRLRGEFCNVGFFGRPSRNECKIWPEIKL